MTMRLASKARDKAALPKGYQFGDAAVVRCFDPKCGGQIDGEIVWLGETYGGVECEWPFHPRCAVGAWPLYEVRRSYSAGWNVIEGEHFTTDRDTGDEA